MKGNFDRTLRLARFILRKERVMSTIWVVALFAVISGLGAGMYAAVEGEARMALALAMENPAMIAMVGPVIGGENYTYGAMFTHNMMLFTVIAVAAMNIFFVVRHTRGDEEAGRYEMVRSLPTGRMANLNATMVVAVLVNAAIAVTVGLGLAVTGDASMGFWPSMLWGASLGAVGLVFAAIAAICAQLTPSAGSATGYSFLIMGVFYVMRAAGDLGAEALSIISPLGLVLRAEVYVANHTWPVLLLIAMAAILMALAYWLNSLRDIDQGFIPNRPGRAAAKKSLLSAFGLSKRLLRRSIIAWVIIMFGLGASYGAVLGDIETFIAQNEFYQMLIGGLGDYSMVVMFASFTGTMMAALAMVPLISTVLKAWAEEKAMRTENVIAAVVPKNRYLAGFGLLAFIASILMQLAMALGLFVAAQFVLPDPGELGLGLLLQANLAYLPALWVIIGGALLLVGLLPKATTIIWAYFGFVFALTILGNMPDILPAWANYLSPLHYIPQLPMDDINFLTMGVLTIIAMVMTAVGLVAYDRRDISPNP